MTAQARTASLRRRPAPPTSAAARYREYARDARRRRAPARPLALTAAAWVLIVALGSIVVARSVDSLGTAASIGADLTSAIDRAFPALGGTISEHQPAATVSVAPVVDELPEFTARTTALLQGHVPAFGLGEGRTVEIAVNGAVVANAQPDAQGRFAQQLILREGTNEVSLALVSTGSVIATTSATVVVDRTPPALALVRPAANATVEGTTVTVEGKAEADARITVNERVVVAAPDGSFTESFTAPAGPLTVTVLARDRAGNETKQAVQVTVKDTAAAGTAGIALSLDRTKVRPGEPVVADVTVLEGGRPKADVLVRLLVGVVDLGTARTNAGGVAKIGFAAPTTEGEIAVVILGGGHSARATLTVAR